jgi:hypothetical protein
VAAGIATLVTRVMGDTSLGKIVATVAPILVMTIASFMILEQLKIAHDIVVTTYTLVLGAIALASALAFGLGGREVAGQMLQGATRRVRRTRSGSSATSTRVSAVPRQTSKRRRTNCRTATARTGGQSVRRPQIGTGSSRAAFR